MFRELRYAIRNLIKTPSFTFAAVGTLALGLGATTAIFAVIQSVLLKPYPFPQAERIVVIRQVLNGQEWGPSSAPDFKDYRAQNASFEHMAAYRNYGGLDLVAEGEPHRVKAAWVTGDFFPVLGIQPERGRFFSPEEMRSDRRLVVISARAWRDNFGSDPGIVGRAAQLGGDLYTVIGVVPDTYRFPSPVDFWLPERFEETPAQNRGSHYLLTLARLKPGVMLQQADADMKSIARRLELAYPKDNAGRTTLLIPLPDMMVRHIRSALWVLFGAVALVLLIACVNVSNLLLARGTARRQEIAVRSALGAGQSRIIREFLVESLIISFAGGVLGLAVAGLGIQTLLAWMPADTLPRQSQIDLGSPAVWFTLGLCMLTPVLFGLMPALRASRLNLTDALKSNSRSSAGDAGSAIRRALIVAEYALAVVLLVGGGSMMTSFLRLATLDPGFEPSGTIAVEMHQLIRDERDAETTPALVNRMIANVRSIPEVESAAASAFLPLDRTNVNTDFRIEGRPVLPVNKAPFAELRWSSPGFLQTMRIPLLEGRDFNEVDNAKSEKVALINRMMARQFWPNASPVGQRIAFEDDHQNWVWWKIVGVIGDVKTFGLDQPLRYEVQMPLAQSIDPGPVKSPYDVGEHLIVRTAGDPTRLTQAISDAIHQVNHTQTVAKVQTLDSVVAESIAQPRLQTSLINLFAGIALTLAGAGLYALISYSVSQRTREIGIRMALGAAQRDVLGQIIREGLGLILFGTLIGIALATALSHVLAKLVFGVGGLDPAVYGLVIVILSAVALSAAWLPARRASKVDPMVALRYE